MKLRIHIESAELYDQEKEIFIETPSADLVLVHSLVSISKWEAKWKKAFLTKSKKTNEELIDYIRCMTINQNVNPNVYYGITQDIVDIVINYIEDPMTATMFRDQTRRSYSTEIITSEVIYYWMIYFNIPVEFQKWHLNRLLTLIKICNIRNNPKKKKNKRDILKEYADLNEQRKKLLNTSG